MKRIEILGSGRPKVCILSIVHGNEICGLSAVEDIKKIPEGNIKGTLNLIRANLEANKENKRFVEINLNRVFPGKQDGKLEEQIAYDISNYMADCDYLLDLHSSSEDTPPFAIVSEDTEEHYKLASVMGLGKYVVLGKVIEGSSLEKKGNELRIAVECGQHTEETTKENAKEIAMNLLIGLGIVKGEDKKTKPEKYQITGKIDIRDKENFVPNQNLKSFKEIKKGEIIGYYKDEPMKAEKDFYPILVDKEMKEELLFIAEPILE